MEELLMRIKDSIKEIRDDVSDDLQSRIAEHLISDDVGVKKLEDLKFVTAEDLSYYLDPIPRRQLVAAWNRQQAPSQQPQAVASTSAATAQQSTARTGTRREDDRWDFTIDWNDIHGIGKKFQQRLEKGKKLGKKYRRELVRRVVLQVRNSVPHANRKIFIQIMDDMKYKYARTFRHELANGVVGRQSIAFYMQTKFDNDRRAPARTRVESESPAIKAAYGCTKWRLTSLPNGQTPDKQEEIRKELIDIFQIQRETAWDWQEINEKMNLTYGTLRAEINSQALAIEVARKALIKKKRQRNQANAEEGDPDAELDEAITPTSELQQKWPFLFQPKGMMEHFRRLTGFDLKEQLKNYVEEELDNTLKFLTKKKKANKRFFKKTTTKAIRDNAEKEVSIKLATLLVMLTNYFEEILSSLVVVIEAATNEDEIQQEIQIPKTPLLVLAGESIVKYSTVYFTCDGGVLGTAANLEEGLALLFGAYFVFNLVYAPESQVTLEFIQRCVVKINPKKGNKRPDKVATAAAKGHFSSRKVHQRLTGLSNEFEDFLADHQADSDSESDNC